jgi:hypothetical protein
MTSKKASKARHPSSAGRDRQRDDLETLRTGLLAAFAVAGDPVKAQIAGQLRVGEGSRRFG